MQHLMRIATYVVLMSLAMASFAQDDVARQKKEINSIKKNSAYLYGEATLADRQAAIDLAKEILYQNINQWVDAQKKFAGANKVLTTNTNYSVEDVTLPRGNWYRAFMYVKKNDIMPVSNVEVTEAPGQGTSQEQAAVSGLAEKPTAQSMGLSEDLMREFLRPANTGQLATMLEAQEEKGTVLDYNKLSAIKTPEQYVMFVFSRDGNIVAVLSAGAERRNLKTGKADSLDNYKGNGAIGVKVNTNR